jgi:SEC-C motif-containing protein
MGRRRDRGCPCGLAAAYDRCCGRFHAGEAAPTAELLMRSRYTAYAREDGPYLLASWHSSSRPATLPFDPSLRWTRLQVVGTSGGGLLDTVGTVHFRATHVRRGAVGVLEEHSRFTREDGRWCYVAPVQ